jgi:hypothetical protein
MADAFATFSFKVGPPRDGGGRRLNEGSDIPSMQPRTNAKRANNDTLAAVLDEALEELAYSPCGFWGCKGPRRPAPMTTCHKCAAMRMIATVKATLELRADLGWNP